jgi:hypothetical protein
MVRAILEGRKTQTRRVVKPQPPGDEELSVGHYCPTVIRNGHEEPGEEQYGVCDMWGQWTAKCPYGAPGDELWVRETWARSRNNWLYAADSVVSEGPQGNTDDWDWDASIPNRWWPSIHMPRSACRLVLTVTGVRVERLQDISEGDAIAEGSYLGKCSCLPPGDKTPMEAAFRQTMCRTHGTEFRHLWALINGPDSWTANPWVWVVEFERKAVS